MSTKSINENLAAEFADADARRLEVAEAGERRTTDILAIHRRGDSSTDLSRGGPGLIDPMPEGVAPTSPPTAAYAAVRAALAYRLDAEKINISKRSGPELKAEQQAELAAKKVSQVCAAGEAVRTYVANVEHAVREFYGLPELDKTDAVAVLTHREIREKTEKLSTLELSRLARENPLICESWMRSPMPLGGQRRELIEKAWRGHVAATNPARAAAIEIGERGAEWAKKTLRTAARTLAGDLRVDGAEIVAQLNVHDLDTFRHVFDLPRGEKRIAARLPRVDAA